MSSKYTKSIVFGGFYRFILIMVFLSCLFLAVFIFQEDYISSIVSSLHIALFTFVSYYTGDKKDFSFPKYDSKDYIILSLIALSSLLLVYKNRILLLVFITELTFLTHMYTTTAMEKKYRQNYYISGEENDRLWELASINFEKSEIAENNFPILPTLGLILASYKYNIISEIFEDSRGDIAEKYRKLLKFKLLEKIPLKDYNSEINDIMSSIKGDINYRECSECEREFRIGNMRYTIEEGKASFICNTCNDKVSESIGFEEALDVMGLKRRELSMDSIEKKYKQKVKNAHPDLGGDKDEFIRLNKARDLLVYYCESNS